MLISISKRIPGKRMESINTLAGLGKLRCSALTGEHSSCGDRYYEASQSGQAAFDCKSYIDELFFFLLGF